MTEAVYDHKIIASKSGDLQKIFEASGNRSWTDFWKTWEGQIPASITLHPDFLQNLQGPGKIADIGCGDGRLCRQLEKEGHQVFGLDININGLVDGNSRKGHTRYIAADGLELPLASDTFNCAILMGVLCLAEQDRRMEMIKEAVRVVKPEGYIYIGEFARVQQPSWDEIYQIDKKYTQEDGTVLVINWNKQKVGFITHHFRKEEITSLLEAAQLKDILLREQEIASVIGGRSYREICAWGTKV